MKEQIQSILKKHNFTDSEFDDVFAAMQDIMYLVVDQMADSKAKEIYREVALSFADMDTFIEDHENE